MRYIIPESPGKVDAYIDAEAYAVYTSILPTLRPPKDAKADHLVIRRETRAYQTCLQPEKEWEPLLKPAIDDYLRLNNNAWSLQPLFRLDIPIELLPQEQIERIMRIGVHCWEEFYRRYPRSGGWIELSAVGFNADKTVAIVYAGWHCHNLCGGGKFHVLQKVDGKWCPLEWKGTWCSWMS